MAKSYSREEAIKITKEYFGITIEEAIKVVDRNDFSDAAIDKMESANEKLYNLKNDYRNQPRMSMYERTKQAVYATGNKWAIENFHATHD